MFIETFALRAELKGSYETNTVDRCGLRWELELSNGNGGSIDVDVSCETIDECRNDWKAETFVQLRLLTANGHGTDEESEEKLVIFNATSQPHRATFMKGDHKFYDVVNKTFLVEATVMIVQTVGIEKKKLMDFSAPTVHRDVLLTVGGQKFYVGSRFLGTMSPFFLRLFGSYPLEKTEFELDDVNPKEFQVILDYLYKNVKASVGNVEGLLKLGKKFEIKHVTGFCEEFLTGNTEIDKRVKLRLSDQYGLRRVLNEIVDSITTFQDLKAHLPGDVYQLKQETLAQLLEKTATQFSS